MKFKFYLQDTVERTIVIDIPIDIANSYQAAAEYFRDHEEDYALPYGEIQKTYTALEKVESAENRIQENGSPFFLQFGTGYISIYESNDSVFPLAEIRVRRGCNLRWNCIFRCDSDGSYPGVRRERRGYPHGWND